MSGERFPRTKAELSNANFWSWTYGLMMSVAFCVVLIELARFAYEWLKYGEISKVLLSDLISIPTMKWVGVQKALSFVWGTQIFVLSLIVMMLSGWIWGMYSEETERLQKELASKQHEAEKKDQEALKAAKQS